MTAHVSRPTPWRVAYPHLRATCAASGSLRCVRPCGRPTTGVFQRAGCRLRATHAQHTSLFLSYPLLHRHLSLRLALVPTFGAITLHVHTDGEQPLRLL